MPWIGRALPDFLREMFQSAPPEQQETFHSCRLVPLFFETLNTPDRKGDLFPLTGTRVPYLNGGLFERTSPAVRRARFPAALFEACSISSANTTSPSTRTTPRTTRSASIPRCSGHIFENLLEDNKDKGAYYTPKAIVQYMCQQSLIHYLRQPTSAPRLADSIERLIRLKEPIAPEKLRLAPATPKRSNAAGRRPKICDPAIGSGAFPIGLLQEIYWTKLTLNPELDRPERPSATSSRTPSTAWTSTPAPSKSPASASGSPSSSTRTIPARSPTSTTRSCRANSLLEISNLKAEFQKYYEAFDSTADLYVYFMEAGVRLLRDGGILNFITSNSFLRTGYGKGLRRFLKKQCAVLRIVDFGGVPVFESAKDTYVCIPLIEKCAKQEPVEICQIPSFGIRDLSAHVAAHRFTIPHERLTDDAWSLKAVVEADLFEKVMKTGKPLGEYIERKFFRGILTGLNEAFKLSVSERATILAETPASSELVKPFLGGQDIRRYHIQDNKRFLIVIPCGWTRKQLAKGSRGQIPISEGQAFDWLASEHPSIAKHLQKFAQPLKKRQDQGDYWWELRACDYYDHLDAPKIVFPDICKAPRFAVDRSGIYLANTAYCLGSDSLYLLGILNSRLFWFAIANISIPFGVRAGEYRYRLIYQYMEKIPIRVINFTDPMDKAAHDTIEALVDRILAAKRAWDEAEVGRLEAEIDEHVFRLYGLTPAEIALVNAPR
jgi:hypothetical protein